MPRFTKYLILPALGLSALLSACGSSSGGGYAASSSSQLAAGNGKSVELVRTSANSTLGGTILVNSRGLTLYHLSGEGNGKFICTSSACVQAWHPLTISSGSRPTGTVGSLGFVKRPNGTDQVTYKGLPLYTFVQDTAPGQARGQGVKDVGTWMAIASGASQSASGAGQSAAGASQSGTTGASQPATGSAPQPSGGSYGY